MPHTLVVADDLTGATDTAHAFAKRGYETAVQVDSDRTPPDATVLAVTTDSRYVDPEIAADRVRGAIETTDTRAVYKKVDSTLRGNVVSEIRGAMSYGFDLALFAPASPALGRITAGGYHLVDGQLLTDTEYADDPNGPPNAHLPTLLAEAESPIEPLGVEVVAAGSESIHEALAEVPSGALVACDTTHERHLEAIARTDSELDGPTLYVGSAGLAAHVAVSGELDSEPRRIAGDGGSLGIVGSVSERSLDQLSTLPTEWVLALDPEEMLADPEDAGRKAGQRTTKRLANGEHTVVTAAQDREAVDRTLELGREGGLDDEVTKTRVANALASAARTGIEEAAGLFVTGGNVAMAVFDALEVRALCLSGEEIEAGIPVSRLDGGIADGTPAVTKAGGFGHEGTVINCLRFLGNDHE
ncbi:four-carbon acid sugar kinase family protein [Halalkalicoccus subterraneus]|uniref:four-carbon acid sugar kinase family protein n=1 Tax=Halalkalicoccus subterraneus TaxID=2675002 RepID=UPI000EFBB20C|nr:four-carbon acid sugar kinase family protein [Halalkalicoccus subterraneus]